jgi:hypothetical protein
MKITWKDPEPTPQQGKRKKILVSEAVIPGHEERFYLFQTSGGMIPTMWTLWDTKTGAQHFLHGEDWEGAQRTSSERIPEIIKEGK